MSAPSPPIPQYNLSPSAKGGVALRELESKKLLNEHNRHKMHRDNHYLIMIAQEGRFTLNVDFNEYNFEGPEVCIIHPGQVHCLMESDSPKGWAIAFDPSLMDMKLQQLIEQATIIDPLIGPFGDGDQDIISLMQMMYQYQHLSAAPIHTRIVHALLTALLGIITLQVTQKQLISQPAASRSTVIYLTFMQLLKAHFASWKKPHQYADHLAVSVAHLNSVVKKASHLTVSGHIQEASVLESKRLLCFTELSIKEIGYQVGYDEPVYFGKMFRKATGITPVQFKRQFHD